MTSAVKDDEMTSEPPTTDAVTSDDDNQEIKNPNDYGAIGPSIVVTPEKEAPDLNIADDEESVGESTPQKEIPQENGAGQEVPREMTEASGTEATIGIPTHLPPSTTEAEEEARLSAEKDEQQKAEEEARMQAEQEENRQRDEETAKQQAEEEAHIKAEQEKEWIQAEAETRNMAEEEARIKADQEPMRLASEAQSRSMAEEEARLMADQQQMEVSGEVAEPATSETPAPPVEEVPSVVAAEEPNVPQDGPDEVAVPTGSETSTPPVEEESLAIAQEEAISTSDVVNEVADPASCESPATPVEEAPSVVAEEEPNVPQDEPDAEATIDIPTHLPPSTTEAEEEARLSAEKDQQQKAEEEARMQAEQEENRQREEETAKKQAEEEARIKAEQEKEWIQAEAETRNMAEEEARIKADQEPMRLASEAQSRSMAEEEARLMADQQQMEVSDEVAEPATSESPAPPVEEVPSVVAAEEPNVPQDGPAGVAVPTGSETSTPPVENSLPRDTEKPTAVENVKETKDAENEKGAESEGLTFCGVSLASVFGDDEKEEATTTTNQEKSTQSASKADTGENAPSGELESPSNVSTASDTSMTASGGAEKRRVSSLVSKYMENATKEPPAGDSSKLQSSLKNLSFSPTPSPVAPSSSRSLDVKAEDLPKIGDIIARFEGSSSSNLVFGEAFRQQQRFSLLADKERKKEAQMKMRGYDEMILAQMHGAAGEVETLSIGKTFTFQTADQDEDLHDGVCKVDYQSADYQGMVFVVHNTRGMLLLNHCDSPDAKASTPTTRIPGGRVVEAEFLSAAKKTGYEKMQLQLAAREGAARQLFETTGIDMRNQLDRLTPAILQVDPPVDGNGLKHLKNEDENRLYYFLQVTDNDFVKDDPEEAVEKPKLTVPNGEVGSPLKLKLAGGFEDFTFIKDPLDAASELKEHGDPNATKALFMVMNQSIGQNLDPARAVSYEGKTIAGPGPQADHPTEGEEWTGGMTLVREQQQTPKEQTIDEKDVQQKASTDTAEQQAVTCCCGFW